MALFYTFSTSFWAFVVRPTVYIVNVHACREALLMLCNTRAGVCNTRGPVNACRETLFRLCNTRAGVCNTRGRRLPKRTPQKCLLEKQIVKIEDKSRSGGRQNLLQVHKSGLEIGQTKNMAGRISKSPGHIFLFCLISLPDL